MCGRFNVTSDPLAELLMALLGQSLSGPDKYNVAPTMNVEVVRPDTHQQALELVSMRWWLTPYWSKEVSTRYSMFNAKSETLEKSSAYREPFRKRRCVVPISGFYEWVLEGVKGNRQKQPYYLRPVENSGLLLAGIWDSWRSREDAQAEPLLSFSIVTTAVHPSLKFVHNRQPVLLSRQTALSWMDPATPIETLQQLMLPGIPEPLAVIPVSSYVNNARHTGARCIEPIGDVIEVCASG